MCVLAYKGGGGSGWFGLGVREKGFRGGAEGQMRGFRVRARGGGIDDERGI